MSQIDEITRLKQIPKGTLIKWGLFLLLVYALYDGVYAVANGRRLMLDLANVSSGLLPKLILNIDVPLLVGGVIICILFARQQMIAALALGTRKQIAWLAIGAVIFVAAVYLARPSGAVEGYEVLHALIIAGFMEELIFRGIFFSWLDEAGLGRLAYLLSGLAWGAHYGIRSMVVSGTMTLWAVLPMAVFGIVVGTLAAFVYKKTDSLWLVAYVHGAVCLF